MGSTSTDRGVVQHRRRDGARWRIGALLIAVALLAVDVSPAGAQSLTELRQRIAQVQAERAAIEARMDEHQRRMDELQVRIAELEDEQASLLREIADHERQIEVLTERVALRVRSSFIHGANLDPMAVFLASDDAVGALSRAQTMQRLVAGDRSRTDELAAARVVAAVAHERLDALLDEVEATHADLEAATNALMAELDAAQQLEQRLSAQERAELQRIEAERQERLRREREAAARRAAQQSTSQSNAAVNVPSGSTACPLDRPRNFIDSWGHARSGGRRHRGTDIMGPHGIPVRAITSGVWQHQRAGRSAGIWGVLRGDDGNHYWYMHLSSHVASNGARVSAGQQVATNGSTGNASASAPHVHFELHPGGGAAVNPYSLLRRVC